MTETGCDEVKDCAVMALAWWLGSVWYVEENKFRLSSFLQPIAVTKRHYSIGILKAIQIYELNWYNAENQQTVTNWLWYSMRLYTAAI